MREAGDPRPHTVPDLPWVYRCKACNFPLGRLVERGGWVVLETGGRFLAHKAALVCPGCENRQNFSRYEGRASG